MIPQEQLDAPPQEQLARQPSWGPAWDAAIAAGVDVALTEENLQLTPAERLEQHHRMTVLWWSLNGARED